ncbi:MAG: hypothetical protein LBI37_01955, partial [Puniceicoccales bacterium]|nr:hypothetical protein [Puniceicoccales bacterium]
MRLFFSSNDKQPKDRNERLSALLKIKRAEAPSKDFWVNFDVKLHRKLLEPVDDRPKRDVIYSFFLASKHAV